MSDIYSGVMQQNTAFITPNNTINEVRQKSTATENDALSAAGHKVSEQADVVSELLAEAGVNEVQSQVPWHQAQLTRLLTHETARASTRIP